MCSKSFIFVPKLMKFEFLELLNFYFYIFRKWEKYEFSRQNHLKYVFSKYQNFWLFTPKVWISRTFEFWCQNLWPSLKKCFWIFVINVASMNYFTIFWKGRQAGWGYFSMVYTYVDCGMRDKLRKSVISTAMARLRRRRSFIIYTTESSLSLSCLLSSSSAAAL